MTALGIALLLAGVVLIIAEAHLAAAGLLGAIGTSAAVAGTVLAVEGAGGGVALAVVLAVLVGLIGGAFALLAARAVGRASRLRVRSGPETLVGAHGTSRAELGTGGGLVFVDGALWQARNAFPEDPVEAGTPIVVERVDGLTLTVRRAEPWELNP